VPFLGQAKPEAKVLVVDHFTVRDRDGNPRLVISRGGRISFRNAEGLEVGSLDETGIRYGGSGPGDTDQTIWLEAPRKDMGANLGLLSHPSTPPQSGGLHQELESLWAHLSPKGPRVEIKRNTGPLTPDRKTQPNETLHVGIDGLVMTKDEEPVQAFLRPR